VVRPRRVELDEDDVGVLREGRRVGLGGLHGRVIGMRIGARAVLIDAVVREVERPGVDAGIVVVAVAAEKDRGVPVVVAVDELVRRGDEKR
jgi:hypothetical protein